MNEDERFEEWATKHGYNAAECPPQYKTWVKFAFEAGSADAMAWRTIESAPKDGSEVWAFNGEQARMKWVSGDGYALWILADDALADIDPSPAQPTHWREIPEEPK